LGEVLGLKTLVLQIKHNEMLGYRDEWLKQRHASQLYGIEWHMRYAYDDNMKAQLLERMDKMQVNEVDGAHIAYENVLRGERLAVMEQAERCIHQAIKMQEYLFGTSHPMVTDSMMTMVRMYIARMNLSPALSLLKLVWASRTGPNTAERLKLGHPRERECSLYHMGITQWLSGNMKAACVILEELLKVDERSVRDMNNVESLLSLCHISGCTAEERIMLAGQCIPWLKIVRPLNLSGVRLSASDALQRDPALVPKTTMRAWGAVGQCLKVNTLVKVLDLSKSAMGPEGAELVKDGICLSKSLVSLDLSGNMIGNTGAVFIRDILRMSKTLTELDMSNNGLEDAGMRVLSSGIAQGSVCYNSTLRRLNIAQNGISPDGALTISLALKVKTVRVSNLDISTNPIYDTGIVHIFDAVFMGTPFVSISLRDCQFGLEGVIKIAEAMRVSDTLKILDLSNRYKDDVGNYSLGNKIDGMGAQVLADAIGDTHSLTCLDVSGNQVSKKGAAALCQV
jgi:Leucine-rich repeat (LRR) protein